MDGWMQLIKVTIECLVLFLLLSAFIEDLKDKNDEEDKHGRNKR